MIQIPNMGNTRNSVSYQYPFH